MRTDLTPPDHIFATIHEAEQALIAQGFRLEPDRGIGEGGFEWIDATGTIAAGIYWAGENSWDPECRIEYREIGGQDDDAPAAMTAVALAVAPCDLVDVHASALTALVLIAMMTVLPAAIINGFARLDAAARPVCASGALAPLATLLTGCEVMQ